jgi:hypothetical protein
MWSQVFSDQQLEDMVDAGWRAFVGILWWGGFMFAAMIVIIINPPWPGSPPVRALLAVAIMAPGAFLYVRADRALKVVAGRNLGLTARESRRLNVREPAGLHASLDRIRTRRDGR